MKAMRVWQEGFKLETTKSKVVTQIHDSISEEERMRLLHMGLIDVDGFKPMTEGHKTERPFYIRPFNFYHKFVSPKVSNTGENRMKWLGEVPEACPCCGEEVYSWQKHKCKIVEAKESST